MGEALLDLKDMFAVDSIDAAAGVTDTAIGIMPIIVGFLASFIVGCLACKWMLSLVKKGKLIWFAVYCVFAALLCLAKGYNLF